MTINKSQGQTLLLDGRRLTKDRGEAPEREWEGSHPTLGISLKQEVFSHGQLYTAFTRTTSGKNMTLAIFDNLKESRLIKNVVWRQALEVL